MGTPNRSHLDYDYCYGSSEYGGCIKGQVAARLGFTPLPPSEAMQELYDRGHAHEAECLIAMVGTGYDVDQRQGEYVIDCGDLIGVIVHVDGIIEDWLIGGPQGERVLEVKSPPTWEAFEKAYKKADYTDPYMSRIAWQVSAQMVATGLEAIIACWDGERVKTFGIELPPFFREQIVARVAEIERQVGLGVLPVACSQRDYPCPYVFLHEDAPPDADPAVDALLVAYAEVLESEKVVKARKETIRESLAGSVAGETYHSEAGKVTRYQQSRKKLVDSPVDGARMVTKWEVESVVEGLRITPAGG